MCAPRIKIGLALFSVFVMAGGTACGRRANHAPTAALGSGRTVAIGYSFTIDASASRDPDGDRLVYKWSIAYPAGNTADLGTTDRPELVFTPDAEGDYTISLTVSDGKLESARAAAVFHAVKASVPVAVVENLPAVPCRTTVTLDGSKSYDQQGKSLTYRWAFVAKPAGSEARLSDPAAAKPAFVADRPGEYVVSLQVDNGVLASAPNRAIVRADANDPPVADAGPNQSVNRGAVVFLDGTGSSDPNGDPLTYNWVVQSPFGVILTGANTAKPSFTADREGTYQICLIVSDGQAQSIPDLVFVTVGSLGIPIADAGQNKTVPYGRPVSLDGSASSDPYGAPLTYTWTPPAGVTLIDAGTAHPSFIPAAHQDYVFTLVVSNGRQNSLADTVTIHGEACAPIADAGADQYNVPRGAAITLDGRGSSDANRETLTYSWKFTAIPPGSGAHPANSTAAQTAFTVDVYGTYEAELTVDDGHGGTSKDYVVITSLDRYVPVADAGPKQEVAVGSTVTLDGRGSYDLDGDPLAYDWSFLTKPSGSTAAIANPGSVRPTFKADRPGLYVCNLIVSDGTLSSRAAAVTIQCVTTGLIAEAGPDQTVATGARVTLDGSGSRDCEGDRFHYRWAIVSKPQGSKAALSEIDAARPWFIADVSGEYRIQLMLYVITPNGVIIEDSEYDYVTITATTNLPIADAGMDRNAVRGEQVNLNASNSYNPTGNPLAYAWTWVSKPNNSLAAINNAGTATPSFTPDVCGIYELQVQASAGALASTDQVQIHVFNGMLDYEVIDAEYDDDTDRIIIVSADQLHIYDPATNTELAVGLHQRAICVSVSPDGRYAAVGHDGGISYVDLAARTLIDHIVLNPSTNIVDLALADNGYAYALSDLDGMMHCVNCANPPVPGDEPKVPCAGSYALLRPGTNQLFTTDGSAFAVYNITGGVAAAITLDNAAPVQGVGERFYFTEDGQRLTTATGKIYTLVAIAPNELELRYHGSLDQCTLTTGVSHTTANGGLFAVLPGDAVGEVQLYDYDYHTIDAALRQPSFVLGSYLYRSAGQYVFFNSAGDRYFVLVKPDEVIGNYAVLSYGITDR